MFRVDFFHKDAQDIVLHSISEIDGLDGVSISPRRISSDDFFAHEPFRVEFSCLTDDWINENILSVYNEIDRYISVFLVRLYNESDLLFTGFMDSSFLTHSVSTESVSFCCYDFTRLFSIYNDLTQLYALASVYSADGTLISTAYNPDYVMRYFLQKINAALSLNITSSSVYSSLTIQKSDLTVLKIDWHEILEPFGDDWLMSNTSYYIGFIASGDVPELQLIVLSNQFSVEHSSWIKTKILAKKWCFYNAICPFLVEASTVDMETDFFANLSQRNEYIDIYLRSFAYKALSSSNSRSFGDFSVSQSLVLDKVNSPQFIEVKFSGNVVPSSLFPVGFYDGEGEQTNCLAVLKAALFLHNLTLYSTPAGQIILADKSDQISVSHVISQNDIIESRLQRLNRSTPGESVLDCLMGDSSVLQDIMVSHYSDLLKQIWTIDVTIDDLSKYNLNLFEIIIINGQSFRITEIQKDYQNDEYSVKGWLI